jgi:prepilin-type N-terminal cleavage/methylation domain-containing protein
MSDMIRQRAFTLVELCVVLVIIGILGTMSIVHFMASQENALNKEVQSNLKLIAAGEKIYRMETGQYVTAADETAINTALRLMLPVGAARKWSYTVTAAGGGTTFVANGTRNDAGARKFTMNQTDEAPH